MGLRPNVRIDIQSALTLTAQAGPGICAIIGSAQYGPIDEVVTLTSFSQALETFKDDLTGSSISLIKGLDLLYANGAGTVLVVRIGDGTEAVSSKAFDGNSGGDVGTLTFDAKYKGTYGDNIAITILTNGSNRDVEITDGITFEVFNNGGTGYSTNADIATAINADSSLVTVTVKVGSETTNLVDAITKTYLVSGANGASGLVDSDYSNALDNLLSNEDFNYLVVPGKPADSFHATIKGKLDTRAASEDKFSVFISGIDVDETIATAKARTTSGERLSLVAPNVKYVHRIDGTTDVLDGSYLACAYTGGIAGRNVQIAPTHKTVNVSGVSVLQSSGKQFYNNGEQEQLLSARIVPITRISGAIQAARGVTRIADTTDVKFEQNIQNIIDFVRKQILTKMNGFIGDPNLERVRTIMAREADGLLQQDLLDEIIAGYLATEVNQGTSPDTVNVRLTIQPTFAVNFINVTLTVSRV